MSFINKDSDYAIRSVLEIAKGNGKPLSSFEIAKKQKIPLRYVRKILGILASHDLIKSREGKGGGFFLNGRAESINLFLIIELMEGGFNLNRCREKKKKCPNRRACVVRKNVKKIEKKMIREFKKITIKKLLDESLERK